MIIHTKLRQNWPVLGKFVCFFYTNKKYEEWVTLISPCTYFNEEQKQWAIRVEIPQIRVELFDTRKEAEKRIHQIFEERKINGI
jgi:hypothetical protein